jgi:hypothetical protein
MIRKETNKGEAYPMSFWQLEKPKSPLCQWLPIHFNRYVGPVGVMKFYFVHPICQSTPYSFDKCFFQTPVSTEKY